MGASLSATEPNKLAIAAISHIVHFDKDTIMKLQEEFMALTEDNDSEDPTLRRNITQEKFSEGLIKVKIHPNDKEILDRLFVLLDRAGDGIIDFKEFLVGSSVLVKCAPEEKFLLAMTLYDRDNTGKISKEELLEILRWMSKISSFFGDKPPTQEALVSLVDRVFGKIVEEEPVDQTYKIYINSIVDHPLLDDFIKQSEDSPRLVQQPMD